MVMLFSGKPRFCINKEAFMLKLSPSILAADFARLGQQCEMVLQAGADMLHIDVMDGHFVPNISLGVPVLESLHKALPDAFYDVHLMISDPLAYVEPFARAGASLITFHLESDSPVAETLAAIRQAGCRAAVSIKPATPPEAVLPWLDQLDMVLVMSVEPGFGGQAFMPEAVDKVRFLRTEAEKRGLHQLMIQVDGGINPETAALCAQAGADVLVAGSAVFRAADPAAALRLLRGQEGA